MKHVNYDKTIDVNTVILSDCENLYNNGGIVVEINYGHIDFYMRGSDKYYKTDLYYKRNGTMRQRYLC